MALEQMEGFELAGRTVSFSYQLDVVKSLTTIFQLRVNTVHEKGSVKYTQQDSLEENGGKAIVLFIRDIY